MDNKSHKNTILRIRFKTNYKTIDWFVAFAVFTTIIWRPLVAWVIPVDAAGRIPFLLLGMAIVLYSKRMFHTVLKYPLIIYCVEAIYMFINGYLQGGTALFDKDGTYLLFCAAVQSPAIMLLTAAAAKKDMNITLTWLLAALFVYPLLALFLAEIDIDGRINGGLNGNEVALETVIFCTLLLFKHLRGSCPMKIVVPLLILPLIVLLRTGSRMGLVMMSIVFLAFILIKKKRRSVKSNLVTIAMMGVFAGALYAVMSLTMMGDRMKMTTSQMDEKKAISTGTVLDLFGDRGFQYYFSWQYFTSNPVFGIGFCNWVKYSPTKTVAHSEYMVQYVENGLLGFIPYLIFFIALLGRASKGTKSNSAVQARSSKLMKATLFAIAFGNSVLWSYNMYGVFIVYGICFVCTEGLKQKEGQRRLRLTWGSSHEKKK